jgi:uncharacterized protein YndB with AHSA1/START domain
MVRYADSPTAEVEVTIDAPPSAVWPLVCDIDLPARFSEEFQGAEWIDDGPARGAVFRGRNRHPMVGEWSVVCTVTDYEPQRVFEWTVGDLDDRTARWRFELAEQGAGCRLSFRAEMGPGPSGLTPAIERMPEREEDIIDHRLEEWSANMRRTVDGIAALAEGAAPTSDR